MRIIRAERGQVEIIDSEKSLTKSEIEANIKMAARRKFQEVSQQEFLELQGTVEKELRESVIEKLDSRFELMAWKELRKDYQVYFRNDPAKYLAAHLQKFCFCKESYHVTSDLSLKFDSLGPTDQSDHRNLIFNNGLTIDGNLDAGDLTSELPLYVLVKGDLKAHNLLLSGWAEVVVTGNVIVSGSVLGLDGESGGRLKVHGSLSATNILGGSMYALEIDGKVNGKVFWLDGDEPSLDGAVIIPTELSQGQQKSQFAHSPLLPEAYSKDSNWGTGEEVVTFNFDPQQAFEILRRGKSVFR